MLENSIREIVVKELIKAKKLELNALIKLDIKDQEIETFETKLINYITKKQRTLSDISNRFRNISNEAKRSVLHKLVDQGRIILVQKGKSKYYEAGQ